MISILLKKHLTLSTAESCTGGLIAHKITNIPGASRYFLGGVVAYSNEAKMKILGVSSSTLRVHGAVSEECAAEMAIGVARLFNASVGVSTTGIAGPSGGTKEKPVGLVYIGYYLEGESIVQRHLFNGSREEIKNKIATRALETLNEILRKKYGPQ